MSSKLDQSLDEITGGHRSNAGRRAPRRVAKPKVVAGGVTKKTAAARPVKAVEPAVAAVQTRGDSKIIVSNLPEDVTEQQIKEYFQSVGPVRKVLLNYNKNGRSVGVANIIFSQPTSAAKAVEANNGVKVDGKPMKIEVVLGAQYVPTAAAAKTLKDRIAVPQKAAAKPKSAAAAGKGAKAAAVVAAVATGAGKGGRRARPARRPKKTAEQLDADMADYFNPNDPAASAGQAATNGTAAPVAAGGEAMVEDEIS